MRRPLVRAVALAALAAAVCAIPVARGHAQQPTAQQAEQRLREERARLDQLRHDREELERRRVSLQNTVHDLSEELENVKRQVEMTSRVVQSLDAQFAAINADVAATTADLVRAQDELEVKRAVLEHRLADIYKRGALYSSEVLLSASSFADLVARYKYLHLAALRDQALVKRVDDLRRQIDRQRQNLVRFQADIENNLTEKADEERRLRGLQQEQATSLARAKANERETERRLEALGQDEERLANVISQLEAARVKAERSAAGKAPSALRRGSTGTLEWPVQGPLLYSFGRVVNPNGTVRWNGIGIGATAGAEVRAIASGRVEVAEAFGTYGLTVIVQHAGGDYSVYGSLSRLNVRKDDVVNKGQVIGYVGTSDPDLPPHLHFELRPKGHAVDPIDYLKPQP